AELVNVQAAPTARAVERKGSKSRKATCPSTNDVHARTLEASKSAPKFGRQSVLAPAKEI
ncbi:MAG TPA: hypothetical protein VIM14_02680, partial [Polyangia bacterium]